MRAFLIAAAWSVASIVAAAPPPDCAGVFLFKPNDRLSIQELSGLVDADTGYAPRANPNEDEFVLVMTPTDWESAAYRGDWGLLAVVHGAAVGTGGTVVGGTLWVKRREAFGTDGGGTFRAAKDGVYLTVKPVTPIKGCRAGYTFKLDAKGVLYAGGVQVGRAKPGE